MQVKTGPPCLVNSKAESPMLPGSLVVFSPLFCHSFVLLGSVEVKMLEGIADVEQSIESSV